jgi:twinkle protein
MMMAKEISILLSKRTDEVAKHLLPKGKKIGNEWRVGSVGGEAGESLGVHLIGDKAGVWCDFSNPNHNGDLLDLWCAVRNLSLGEAIKEAANYLSISSPRFEGHKPKSFDKPKQQLIEVLPMESTVMNYLVNERKLTRETVLAFKISRRGEEIVFPYWREGELILLKYIKLERVNGKKQVLASPNCEPCLFGWHLIPANNRKITLCEGEIDAMSLHQYGYPALSVPFGGGGGDKQKWIEYEYERLAIFNEIYLCFDNDNVGRETIIELVNRLGRHRCRIVTLPKKDANECLQAGVTKDEIDSCFLKADFLDPEELRSAHEYLDDVIGIFYPSDTTQLGYYPPWDKAKNKIYFRLEELSVWTGINGHGKSQFLSYLLLSQMKQGARVCIASLELKPKRLLYRLTRQATGLAEPTEDYIAAVHEWYKDKLWLFDLVGTAKSERLLEVFLYARQRYGVDVFVIDSFMKLDIAEDDYKAQKAFMEKLCDFKNQYNCHIHIVVHPRKGADETSPPGKLDNKGTGAISDLADNCFTVWRNKNKEALFQAQASGVSLTADQQQKLQASDCLWCCDKQRNGDWEGKFGFWFHAGSLQYLSFEGQPPVQFISYSKVDPAREGLIR